MTPAAPTAPDPGARAAPTSLAPSAWLKYHALGNDYLVMDGTGRAPPPAEAVRALCDRHHGVGSDGLLWHLPGVRGAHAQVRIYNPDGSEAEKSGNGLRIYARFVFDTGYVTRPNFCVAVGNEVVRCTLLGPNGAPATPRQDLHAPAQVATVRTEMGHAKFVGGAVGMVDVTRDTHTLALPVGDELLDVTCVGLGNPHCVVFGGPQDRDTLLRLGPQIERHPWFTRRINVQLAHVVARDRLEVRIWERGAGETLASGSSSCAAAAAAHARNLLDASCTVSMPGGEVAVELGEAGAVTLTGPATPVARGELWPAPAWCATA